VDIANGTAFTNNASALTTIGVNLAPVITYTTAVGSGSQAWRGYYDASTHQAGVAARLAGIYYPFHASPTFQVTDNAAAQTVTVASLFRADVTLAAGGSTGTLTVNALNQFVGAGTTVPANVTVAAWTGVNLGGPVATGTVTTRKGVNIAAASGAGLGTDIGIDIAAMTAGTVANIGIRNASPTVYTPSSVQALVAGTTIVADASTIHITSSGIITLTANPLIAAGQNGQVLRIINDNTTASRTITFTSESGDAGIGLSLGAATRAVGPGGSITLIYSSAHSKWVECGINLGGQL